MTPIEAESNEYHSLIPNWARLDCEPIAHVSRLAIGALVVAGRLSQLEQLALDTTKVLAEPSEGGYYRLERLRVTYLIPVGRGA